MTDRIPKPLVDYPLVSDWIAFDHDGRVSVKSGRVELGQGALSMLLIMFAVLLVLGMFVDAISMMLLTIPIFFPIALSLGYDPVWFGLIMLLAIEMSGTTPPFGLLLFVMQGVAPPGTSYWTIVRAAIPYLFCDLILLAALIALPALALWLPGVRI